MAVSALSISATLLFAINISSIPLKAPHSPGIWDPQVSTPAPAGITPDVREVANLDSYAREQIRDGRASGELSHRQARQLGCQEEAIEMLAGRYSQDSFSDSELGELRSRLEALNSLIYVEAAKPLP